MTLTASRCNITAAQRLHQDVKGTTCPLCPKCKGEDSWLGEACRNETWLSTTTVIVVVDIVVGASVLLLCCCCYFFYCKLVHPARHTTCDRLPWWQGHNVISAVPSLPPPCNSELGSKIRRVVFLGEYFHHEKCLTSRVIIIHFQEFLCCMERWNGDYP